MIGMILVTHGRLAEELRSAMEHVVGTQRNVDTVCIGPDDDMDNRRAEIEAVLQAAAAHDVLRRSDVLRRFLTDQMEGQQDPNAGQPADTDASWDITSAEPVSV